VPTSYHEITWKQFAASLIRENESISDMQHIIQCFTGISDEEYLSATYEGMMQVYAVIGGFINDLPDAMIASEPPPFASFSMFEAEFMAEFEHDLKTLHPDNWLNYRLVNASKVYACFMS
jgi:hypothetical protein